MDDKLYFLIFSQLRFPLVRSFILIKEAYLTLGTTKYIFSILPLQKPLHIPVLHLDLLGDNSNKG